MFELAFDKPITSTFEPRDSTRERRVVLGTAKANWGDIGPRENNRKIPVT